jgi:hypothetical protein
MFATKTSSANTPAAVPLTAPFIQLRAASILCAGVGRLEADD